MLKPLIKELDKGTIKHYSYIIGIDTGVNTGWASWSRSTRALLVCDTMPIHRAMEKVKQALLQYDAKENILVRVEDARLAVHGRTGQVDKNKLQGAGSVKRDAKIWFDFLTDLGVDFEMVRPKKASTKLTSEFFTKITKWKGRTNQHSRDAAMLVFGY